MEFDSMSIYHSHEFTSAHMKSGAINFIHNGTSASSCLELSWISYSTPKSVAEPRRVNTNACIVTEELDCAED